MIAAARKRLPGTEFEEADIAGWLNPGPFDVILANACLQWVPDHRILFPALLQKLASGGTLAVQMPDNLDEPAHRLVRAIAADGPWAAKLGTAAAARAERHAAIWYHGLLMGAVETVDLWQTTYFHALAGGGAAVVEWFKGTGLRPFLDPLDDGERVAFLDRYRAALEQAYPPLPDGSVLLPFPRLFILATRR